MARQKKAVDPLKKRSRSHFIVFSLVWLIHALVSGLVAELINPGHNAVSTMFSVFLLIILPLNLLHIRVDYQDAGWRRLERREQDKDAHWRWYRIFGLIWACVQWCIFLLAWWTVFFGWAPLPIDSYSYSDTVFQAATISLACLFFAGWLDLLVKYWAVWGRGKIARFLSSFQFALRSVVFYLFLLGWLLCLTFRYELTVPLYICIAIVVFFTVARLFLTWRELRQANRILEAGGSLFLFADSALEAGDFTHKEIISMAEPLAAGLQGRYLLYGKGLVLADYSLYSSGLLTPGKHSDRRMVLLLSGSITNHPQRSNRHLLDMAKDGWKILPLLCSEYSTYETGYRLELYAQLIKGLPTPMRRPTTPEQEAEILQAWLLKRELEGQTGPVARLGHLVKELEAQAKGLIGEEARCYYTFVINTCNKLIWNYDEVKCFYAMMTVIEYIIHCRALINCRVRKGVSPSLFPDDPSLGSLEDLQAPNCCGPRWAEARSELINAAMILRDALEQGDKVRGSYRQICNFLASLRNRYIAHGTLVYQVTPEVAEALLTVADYMARDFFDQGVFPVSTDQILVQRQSKDQQPVGVPVPVPSCQYDGETSSVWLFSFLPRDVKNTDSAEYLDYNTGGIRLQGGRRPVIDLGFRPSTTQRKDGEPV